MLVDVHVTPSEEVSNVGEVLEDPPVPIILKVEVIESYQQCIALVVGQLRSVPDVLNVYAGISLLED